MANKFEIADRRTRVAWLLFRGVPQRDIARQLGHALCTIVEDVRAINKEWGSAFKNNERLVFLGALMGSQNERIRGLWGEIADKGSSQKNRVAAYAALRGEMYGTIKLLEKAGVVPRDVELNQFNSVGSQQVVFQQVNVNEIISKFAEEEIKEKKARVLEDGSGK